MKVTVPDAAAISPSVNASLWSASVGPTWTNRARPRSRRAISKKSAHPFSRTSRLTMRTTGSSSSAGRWPGPLDPTSSGRRRGPGREVLGGDAVADVGELAPRTDAHRGQDTLVFAALDHDTVRPGAAPALEAPAEHVRRPAVAPEVQRTVDGVDRRRAAQSCGGESEKGRLGRVGLDEVEPLGPEESHQAHEGQRIRCGELSPDRYQLDSQVARGVGVGVPGHDRPVDVADARPAVVRAGVGPSSTWPRPGIPADASVPPRHSCRHVVTRIVGSVASLRRARPPPAAHRGSRGGEA